MNLQWPSKTFKKELKFSEKKKKKKKKKKKGLKICAKQASGSLIPMQEEIPHSTD